MEIGCGATICGTDPAKCLPGAPTFPNSVPNSVKLCPNHSFRTIQLYNKWDETYTSLLSRNVMQQPSQLEHAKPSWPITITTTNNTALVHKLVSWSLCWLSSSTGIFIFELITPLVPHYRQQGAHNGLR